MTKMEVDPPPDIKMLSFQPQREAKLDKVLPYYDKINDEAALGLAEIKANFGKAIVLRNIQPGARFWLVRLRQFLNIYDLRMSKEDHITFVKLLYELLVMPDTEICLVLEIIAALNILLRKTELISPEELQLPWQPLFELYENTNTVRNVAEQVFAIILKVNKWFPTNSTAEILDVLLPKMCPMDKARVNEGLKALTLFLPTMPHFSKDGIGHHLWMEKLMNVWEVCNNANCMDNHMMKLIARLARDNVGLINWDPYMDIMFTRIMRCLKLPVGYVSYSRLEPDTGSDDAALWIVAVLGGGSSGQKHLNDLLKALESYFYPANSGRWLCKLHALIKCLTEQFLKRLFYERKKNLRWLPQTPKDHHLTENDITEFVDSLKPIVAQAINSNHARFNFLKTLYGLSWLRPGTIIPLILDRFYTSVNAQTEPHRLSSALLYIGSVSRPMVEGARLGYSDGPLQVIPLLMAIVQCIDPNDMTKTNCAFTTLSRLMTYIPLIDCSQEIGHHSDMTPFEEELCRSTAELDDFLMQIFDRMLSLISHLSSESVRHEQKSNVNSKLEFIMQETILSVTQRFLCQTPMRFFKLALHKLHDFVTSTILESSVYLLGAIVSAFVSVNTEESLKVLFPPIAEAIINGTESEDVQKEQRLSSELLYNISLMTHLTSQASMKKLFPYVDTLYKILERTLNLENFDGHYQAQHILSNIVSLANMIQPTNLRSSSHSYDSPPGEYLLIRDWGRSYPVEELNLKWYIPGNEEFSFIQSFVNKFLPSEIQRIENFIDGSETISREALQRSLRIVGAVLQCQPLLPFWEEDPLPYSASVAPEITILHAETAVHGEITMPDGSNMRYFMVKLMHRLQDKLLSNAEAEDDTLSCVLLNKIWRLLLIYWGSDITWQQYKELTKWERDPLATCCLTRMTLITGATIHVARRTAYFGRPLTPTYGEGVRCVFKLATSRYSKVRKFAQTLLTEIGDRAYAPLLHQFLLPDMLYNLGLDTVENHEKFKGTLYVFGSMYATYDWKLSKDIWLALIKSKPTEKLSVIRRIEEITNHMLQYEALDKVQIEVPDSIIQEAASLWGTLPIPTQPKPTDEQIKKALENSEARNLEVLNDWKNLQVAIVKAAESPALHWRHGHFAIACILRVACEYELSPPDAVRHSFNSLIDGSIHIRKVALKCVTNILQQQGVKTNYVTLDESSLKSESSGDLGDNRPDAFWLQYHKDRRPLTSEQWNEQKFYHKEYMGFFKWPKEIKVQAPYKEQTPLDGPEKVLTDEEKEVDKFFLNEKNIDLFVSYNSLEKKNNHDFVYVIGLFSRLFKHTGDKYLPLFKPHIYKLLDEKQECHQLFLFELLAGIIRGTKRWPFEKVSALWEWLTPVVRSCQENLCVVDDAGLPIRLATSHLKRDPYNQHWLIEILLDDPLGDRASSLGCRRLVLIKSILAQKHWRATSISSRVLEYLRPFLAHPYKNVRIAVGMLLAYVFTCDFQLLEGKPTRGPHLTDFLASVIPQMEILKSLNVSVQTTNNNGNGTGNGNGSDLKLDEVVEQLDQVDLDPSKQDTALRLFKTISVCMQEMLCHSPVALYPDFYELFELSTLLENVEKDKELRDISKKSLALLSSAFTLPQHLPVALEAIRKVVSSPSWSMRASCLKFLQVLVFQNMAVFRSRKEWVAEVVDIVLTSLEDVWLEVQQKAGEVLGGLIHNYFIPNNSDLLESLKKKAQTKVSRKSPDPAKLRVRHAGVIGLCAFVNAFPYDVPEFVPEVIGILGAHLNDPHPISTTIHKALSNFQRTHTADWHLHRLRFTEDQLNALNDMVLPPPHYV